MICNDAEIITVTTRNQLLLEEFKRQILTETDQNTLMIGTPFLPFIL